MLSIIARICARWREPGGYREIITLAFPLILSTGATSVLHFVDRVFLTWHSPEANAASMPAGMVSMTVMALFIGTAGYVNTFIAQNTGAGRPGRVGPNLWHGLYIAIAGGVVLLVVSLFSGPIFDLVGHDLSIRGMETDYFAIQSRWGIFPILASAFAGFYSGRQKSWTIVWASVIGLVVNVALDYVMIFGHFGFPADGIVGAARATVIASAVTCLFYAVLIFTPANERIYRVVSGFRFDPALFSRLLKFGTPAGAQFVIDLGGFSMFILLVGRLGVVELAATNIVLNVNALAFLPLLGFGVAISVIVGRQLGAADSNGAQRSVFSAAHIGLLLTTAVAVSFVLILRLYLSAFAIGADRTEFEPIQATSIVLLRFVAAFMVADAVNIVFASALKGAGDTRFVMFMIAVLSLVGLVGPTYLAVEVLGLGVYRVWLIASIYVGVLGSSFFIRFMTGKWRSMRVIG